MVKMIECKQQKCYRFAEITRTKVELRELKYDVLLPRRLKLLRLDIIIQLASGAETWTARTL